MHRISHEESIWSFGCNVIFCRVFSIPLDFQGIDDSHVKKYQQIFIGKLQKWMKKSRNGSTSRCFVPFTQWNPPAPTPTPPPPKKMTFVLFFSARCTLQPDPFPVIFVRWNLHAPTPPKKLIFSILFFSTVHSTARPFSCNICQMKFKTKDILKKWVF